MKWLLVALLTLTVRPSEVRSVRLHPSTIARGALSLVEGQADPTSPAPAFAHRATAGLAGAFGVGGKAGRYVLSMNALDAQAPPAGGRGAPAPPPAGRAGAPFELTGYWMALVTDDWRYRMLTPPKGNVDYLPVNAEARRVTEMWDPAKDEAAGEQCRSFGAAGVMRLPGRLHITWEDEDTLRIDTDAGTQTRRFTFGATPAPSSEPTWQGTSVARWAYPVQGRGRGPVPTGQLVVTTRAMRPGYLRKNGVPYSDKAVLTEYIVRLVDNAKQEYLAVTTMVDDPQYLVQPYVKTYQFKKQPNADGWNPTPCSAK